MKNNRLKESTIRISVVAQKEFLHIKRDKPSTIISFMLPIVMLLLFGFAINTDVKNVKFTLCDLNQSQYSRSIETLFSNSLFFELEEKTFSVSDATKLLDEGRVSMALIIPETLDKNIARGVQGAVQVIVDGSDPSVAKSAMANAHSILTYFNKAYSDVSVAPLYRYNPSLDNTLFNIPGVVGLILQNITIVLTALALVREKELGTMEQLIMTPINSIELIIGKLIPYVIIGVYDFLIVLLLSRLIFGLSIQGSFLELSFLGLIFLLGALAMGMLISTIAKNQAQAIQATLAFLLPSVLLSGFMFPRNAMPLLIRAFSALFPITHFLTILRGVIVKGVGIAALWHATLYMVLLVLLLIGLAALKFKKTLDD